VVVVVVVEGLGLTLVVKVGGSPRKGEVNGRASRAKTSPERMMGTWVPYRSVRSSMASRLMGALDGVWRVRGWMVMKSMSRQWGWPMRVLMKSQVFLGAEEFRDELMGS
jgi:hypothetical protein